MNKGNNIQDELKSMGSILAGMSRAMPYSVPAGYFENLEMPVNNTIKDLNEPEVTPNWGKTLPYAIPDGYFEMLPDELVARVTTGYLPKESPYSIPTGYFEALPAQMLQAAKGTETKVIPVKRRTLSSPVKWLAAAILVLGLGLGAYRVFNMQNASGTEKILSSVPNNEIHDYLQRALRVDIDRIVKTNPINNMNVDNKDIIQYLNETGWD